jgi:hypothetical protein
MRSAIYAGLIRGAANHQMETGGPGEGFEIPVMTEKRKPLIDTTLR